MQLTVRPATAADVATIVDFNLRLAAETEGKALDAKVVERGVAALIADPNKGRYSLACEGGEVLGQHAISYEWSDWRNGWIWWLQSVYVRADCRGRGVFKKLYQELEKEAREAGVACLRLYVERENHVGQATYQAVGMSLTSYEAYEQVLRPV